jgi:hypothetical protein
MPFFQKNSLTRPNLQLCHQFLRHFGVIVGGAVAGRAGVGVSAPGGVARAPEGGRRIRVHHIAGLYLHHPGPRAQPAIEYWSSGRESLLRQGVIAKAGSHYSGRKSLFRQGVIVQAGSHCSVRESLLIAQEGSHCSGKESLLRQGVIAQAGNQDS